jgi:hypothetical protein
MLNNLHTIRLTVGIFLTLISFSCHQQKEVLPIDDTPVIEVQSIEPVLSDSSIFGKPQIICLQTADNSLIARVSKIGIDENLLFIFSRRFDNTIYSFHKDTVKKDYIIDFKPFTIPPKFISEPDDEALISYVYEHNNVECIGLDDNPVLFIYTLK